MTVTHDDMPHPVPPLAFLRYKENWFFIILDEPNDLYGAIHVVSEPGFERIGYACHLSVCGEHFTHRSAAEFPAHFAMAPEIGDGALTVRFVKAHEQIDFSLHNSEIDLDISFLRRTPVFNFEDYDHANPDKISVSEVLGMASGQQYVYQ